MKVAELIERLNVLPGDANVALLWDGATRGDADYAYLSRSGEVIIAPGGQHVYNKGDLPKDRDLKQEGSFWRLPEIGPHGQEFDVEDVG